MSFTSKILDGFQDAVMHREELRKAGKTVVLTNGVFDLLHRGHLYCLWAAVEIAKKHGADPALMIALNSDESVKALKGPTRPVQPWYDRAYALAALEFVNAVFVFTTPRLDNEILRLRPDVYVKASDYTLEKLDGGERSALEKVGAHIEFVPFLKDYSTTELIKKIAAAAKVGAI